MVLKQSVPVSQPPFCLCFFKYSIIHPIKFCILDLYLSLVYIYEYCPNTITAALEINFGRRTNFQSFHFCWAWKQFISQHLLNFFSSWIDHHLCPWHSSQQRFLLVHVVTVHPQIFAALYSTCREVESEKNKLSPLMQSYFFHYNSCTTVSVVFFFQFWRAFGERPRELNFWKFSLFVSVYYDFISTENKVCEMEKQRYGARAQHHFSAIMHPRRLSGLRYELAGGKESLGVRCERSHESDRLIDSTDPSVEDLRVRKHASPFLTVDFRHQSAWNWV